MKENKDNESQQGKELLSDKPESRGKMAQDLMSNDGMYLFCPYTFIASSSTLTLWGNMKCYFEVY